MTPSNIVLLLAVLVLVYLLGLCFLRATQTGRRLMKCVRPRSPLSLPLICALFGLCGHHG